MQHGERFRWRGPVGYERMNAREGTAEDFDALSLAHNLVVPPILVVAAFTCHAPIGLSIEPIKLAHRSCAIAQKR
jgi:hypothetical protein